MMQRKSKDVDEQNAKRLSASRGPYTSAKDVRAWRGRKIKVILEDKVHTVLETYGEKPVLYRVQAENDPNSRTRKLYCNMLQPCDDLLRHFQLEFDRKRQEETQ